MVLKIRMSHLSRIYGNNNLYRFVDLLPETSFSSGYIKRDENFKYGTEIIYHTQDQGINYFKAEKEI